MNADAELNKNHTTAEDNVEPKLSKKELNKLMKKTEKGTT